jgi:hypothetical protein
MLGGSGGLPDFRRNIPRQQVRDAIDGMFRDARQEVPQVSFGIDTVQLGSADQAVERCGTLAAAVRSSEQVVLGVL